eukprot:4142852-Prymnesium_polylepis.1
MSASGHRACTLRNESARRTSARGCSVKCGTFTPTPNKPRRRVVRRAVRARGDAACSERKYVCDATLAPASCCTGARDRQSWSARAAAHSRRSRTSWPGSG